MSGAPLLYSSGLEMVFLVLLALLAVTATEADVTIDLSRAELDQETGQFCVMQKVRKFLCL